MAHSPQSKLAPAVMPSELDNCSSNMWELTDNTVQLALVILGLFIRGFRKIHQNKVFAVFLSRVRNLTKKFVLKWYQMTVY